MVVAALRNFQIGGISRCEQDAPALHLSLINLAEIAVHRARHLHDCAHRVDDIGITACAEHSINLRHFLGDLLRIALHQTAGDNQCLELSAFFQLRCFQNGLNGFLLCGFDKAAGIDDRNIRICDIIDNRNAGFCKLCQHVFAVHKILGTAQ